MIDTNDLEKGAREAEALAKSHIKQYARKDGTIVKEHDDSRQKKAAASAGKGKLPGHWRDAHDHAVNTSEQAWNGQADHKDAIAALKHSARLHMDAESAADRDGDQKAAEHHGDKARDQLTRAKQHLEEVKRGGKPRAASGAADKLMAAAEKHQADMDWGNPDTAGAAKKYSAAAIAHIQAMEEAAGAKDSESQRHHYYKATTALSHAHSMSTFQKGNEEATAKQATSLAKHISGIANKQRGEDNGHDLDHGSALHLLAAEQHGRAAEAHMAMANKQADSKTLSKEHTKLAQHHRDQQIAHGKEVQRLTGIAIKASDAAKAAGKAAKSPEQHKLAAEAHRNAAKMNWDRESRAEHEKMAGYHADQAKAGSAGGAKGGQKAGENGKKSEGGGGKPADKEQVKISEAQRYLEETTKTIERNWDNYSPEQKQEHKLWIEKMEKKIIKMKEKARGRADSAPEAQKGEEDAKGKTITVKRRGSKDGIFYGTHVEDQEDGGAKAWSKDLPAEGNDVRTIHGTYHEGDSSAAPVADSVGDGIDIPESVAAMVHGKYYNQSKHGELPEDAVGMLALKMQGVNVAHFPDKDDPKKIVSIDLRHMSEEKLRGNLKRLISDTPGSEYDKPVDTSKWSKIKDPVKKSISDDLGEAADAVEQLTKAHVKQHMRRTKSGGVVTVKEHEDARASKGVHLNRKMEGKTYAGQEVRIIVAATTSGGKKLHALKTTTGATIATTYGDPSELQEYAKNKWLKVVEHEDARQSHPNVIGVADGLDDHPEKASGFTFEGRRYYSTGKSGNSLHDGTPVREFEAGKEHNYHRAWLDHSGRVHADDITEAARYRKK